MVEIYSECCRQWYVADREAVGEVCEMSAEFWIQPFRKGKFQRQSIGCTLCLMMLAGF